MANTTIALRQSGATGNTPSLGVIANGELSLNYADGILYYKTSSNTLGSIRTTQPAGLTTEVQFNDAGSFGSTSQVTINKSSGEFRATTIKSTQSSGDEGGQIDLATAATNSTLAGGYVNIDVYQNKLRIFEAGGTNRGVFIDMANSAAVGVGTDLLGSATIGQAAFNKANTANITAEAAFSKANTANITAEAAFAKANTDVTGISVTPGTYGNASAIPSVTVDANGRISAISTNAFTAATIGDVLAISIALG